LSIGEKFRNAVSVMAEQAIDIQKEIRIRLEKSNARNKAAANKRRREKVFEEGDIVIINLRKERIHTETYNKLKPKKYGSFQIVKKINNNPYL